MAAEIYEDDGAVFANSTWHGLGNYVGDALDPKEAMRIAGLDWLASKQPVYASFQGENVYGENYSAIVREDTKSILSIQSKDYQVVQNYEVFDLAYALGDRVKVESAFTMNNGRKLVVLLKTGSFISTEGTEDVVDEYLALLNSMDGTIALSGLGTSVRIVCSNTLNMALSANKKKSKKMFRITHAGDMEGKIDAMRNALHYYAKNAEFFEEAVKVLGKKTMTSAEISKFWLDVWGMIEEPVVANPQTDEESRNYREAAAALAAWSETFDQERSALNLPANLWVASNAVTKWLQHKDPARGRKPTTENRAYNNLLGKQSDLTTQTMNYALELV